MASDKLSIKDLLFTRALPNYITPIASKSHKVYSCTDCGDKYYLESSLNTHIQRKSLKITYMCRHCGQIQIFLNRCTLLSHIRSHAFRTATINVSDLKIEPLPLQHFNIKPTSCTGNPITDENDTQIIQQPKIISQNSQHFCFECKTNICVTFVLYKDRASHYMQVSSNMTCYSCPICLFSLPTVCALKAHLRIHLGKPPYFCPECGVHIPNKCVVYPYNHDCEGFKTIRATTRSKCHKNNCLILHPNDYSEHVKSHIAKIYACTACPANWPDLPTKHNCNNENFKIVKYLQCPLCSYKAINKNIHRHINNHFKNNVNILKNQVFPCRLCNDVYDQVHRLLNHQIQKHGASKSIIESLITKDPQKSVYRVVKRCEKCLRSFTYRCPYDKIKILPSECPYKCSFNSSIKCFVCGRIINCDWKLIKKHFFTHHKEHNCVDIKVNLFKLNLNSKVINKKIKNTKKIEKFKETLDCDKITINSKTLDKQKDSKSCNVCGLCFINKIDLEKHIVSHKDLCMAYQCLECGKCFAVKPSFSTHLLLEHQIPDVDNYISEKHCYNELAFVKSHTRPEDIAEGPVEENQCRICREQFQDNTSLEKHFRVHGMAFLMENTIKSGIPS